MTDYTVSQYGVDTSGRAILASAYMWGVWEDVVADLGFRPVITQGAWMARVPGGGADNSHGYHDGGGCFDLRVWDRTAIEKQQMVRVLREHGCAAWRRYKTQGMDEDHLHFVLGTDHGLTDGAAQQWRDYLAGYDGLYYDDGHKRPDYEWRPDPLVTTPPEDDMPFTEAELRAIVSDELDKANARLLNTKVGNDDTTFKQVLNKLKTWLARN